MSDRETGTYEDYLQGKKQRRNERKKVVIRPVDSDKEYPFTVKRLSQRHRDKINDSVVETEISNGKAESKVDSAKLQILTIKFGVDECPEGFKLNENQIAQWEFRSELADKINEFSELDEETYINL